MESVSDNLWPSKKSGLKNYWLPLKAISLQDKTQSEHHQVWGEVLNPKASRPWKQPNKIEVLWSFLARCLHQFQPPGQQQMASTKGRVFAIMCYCWLYLIPLWTTPQHSSPLLRGTQGWDWAYHHFQASFRLSAWNTPQNSSGSPPPHSSARLHQQGSACTAGVGDGERRRRLLSAADFPALTLW